MAGSYPKARIFRSNYGCCICGTKSSTSRFVSSQKYEDQFEACFKVSSEERYGEICNACVLHVKRFSGNQRSCEHFVDSRLGPRARNGRPRKLVNDDVPIPRKHKYKPKRRDELYDKVGCGSSYNRERQISSPLWRRNRGTSRTATSFFAKEFFKRRRICCGVAYMFTRLGALDSCLTAVDSCLTTPCVNPSSSPTIIPSVLAQHINITHNVIVQNDYQLSHSSTKFNPSSVTY